ncbi:hypothetical protein QTP86_001728, partial [Hemibagrus guttatus]
YRTEPTEQRSMSAPDPLYELVEALRRALASMPGSTAPASFSRLRRGFSFATCDRESCGRSGALLRQGGGLQRVHAAVFIGPGDAAALVP